LHSDADVPHGDHRDLSARLRAACKTTIAEFEARAAHVALVLIDLCAFTEELTHWVQGDGAQRALKEPADPLATLQLNEWYASQCNRREQLRLASERSFAALQAALMSTGALFDAEGTVVDVQAWGGASAQMLDAKAAVSSELDFFGKAAMSKALADKVMASLLASFAAESWLVRAERCVFPSLLGNDTT
jgi:hypothetical protein